MAECRTCHQEIDWAVKFPEELKDDGTPKVAPVNRDSADDPKGTLEVWRQSVIPSSTGQPATVLYFRYLRKGEQPPPGRHRGVSHFATCGQAAQHRRPPASPRPEGEAERWPRGSNGEAANRGRA